MQACNIFIFEKHLYLIYSRIAPSIAHQKNRLTARQYARRQERELTQIFLKNIQKTKKKLSQSRSEINQCMHACLLLYVSTTSRVCAVYTVGWLPLCKYILQQK